MNDADDLFIGRCLIEAFAWRKKDSCPQPWSAVRHNVPYDSADAIGTRFRHCSALPMLTLLATRINLLFDDDDDGDHMEDDSNPFLTAYVYLRDYSSINQTKLSENHSRALDCALKRLELLQPELSELQSSGDSCSLAALQSQHTLDIVEKGINADGPAHCETEFPTQSRDECRVTYSERLQTRTPHQFIKEDHVSTISKLCSETIETQCEDEWNSGDDDSHDDDDNDAGWAAVSSLSAPKERDIFLSGERWMVQLNCDVDVLNDRHNLEMSSIFPLNELSSDSEEDCFFDDPNRQFDPEWNVVAFLPDGISSVSDHSIPKQGSEFDKRPLGEMFHVNSLAINSSSAEPQLSSKNILALVTAPKDRSENATPLLVRNNQKRYLLFERTVTVPKIELSAPYRPWSQIRSLLYSQSSISVVTDQTYDLFDDHVLDLDWKHNGPPAIISVPLNLEPASLAHPVPKVSATPSRQHFRFRKKFLPNPTKELIKRALFDAILSYSDHIPASDQRKMPASQSHKLQRIESDVSERSVAASVLRPSPFSQHVDVKPLLKPHTLSQPPSTSSVAKTKSKKNSASKVSAITNSRLLSANPISIDACLRAGHNYLQLLMTWIQKNYGAIVCKPSAAIRVEYRNDSWLATFDLPVDPPLKIQAVSHASSKKAAKHEIARQTVLYLQKRKFGDVVKFNQKRVDSRADKMAMSAAASFFCDVESDSESSTDMDVDPPVPVLAAGFAESGSESPGRRSDPVIHHRPSLNEMMISNPVRINHEVSGSSSDAISPRRRNVPHLVEPPWKKTRNDAVTFQSRHNLSASSELVSVQSAAAMPDDILEESKEISPPSASLSGSKSSQFLVDLSLQSSCETQIERTARSLCASIQQNISAGFTESDVSQAGRLSSSDPGKTNFDRLSPALPPLLTPSAFEADSAFENEARLFLDSLSPTAPSLCVAKKPGDPFIIYLDDESFGDDEMTQKQSKLVSIKTELMLLKEKIARVEAMKGLQKRDDSST